MKPLACWLALTAAAIAGNPYLAHKDDAPITRQFAGKEWGDEVDVPRGKESVPLTATVTTQRVLARPWGEVYKITIAPSSKREIGPYLFLALDSKIVLLNTADFDREIRALQQAEERPNFEMRDVWGLTKATMKLADGPWVTTITGRDGASKRVSEHEGSGHFSRVEWKRGVGLVGIAMGQGARRDGFELAWKAPAKPAK